MGLALSLAAQGSVSRTATSLEGLECLDRASFADPRILLRARFLRSIASSAG
jgi:hypothetical protein